MDILDVDYIKKPSTVTFGALIFFLFLGCGVAMGMVYANLFFFTSQFAYLSMALFLYFLVQMKVVTSTYKKYDKTKIKMNKIQISTGFYWLFAATLFIPFVYTVISSIQLIGTPYNPDGFDANLIVILDFAKKYSPSPEIFNYFHNYGIFSIVVPYILSTTLLLAFSSWLYIRRMRNYHAIELEESIFQKKQAAIRRKENKEHKSYKWS